MRSPDGGDGGLVPGRLLRLLCLLWLAGLSMRITILAVPPVIPLIRTDLHMSETQVGLLVALPLAIWALAAVPGSLLIARLGATFTLTAGLVVTALAGAGRGAAPDVWLLYLATALMGSGIAIMQPAIPTLVGEWLPRRIGVGAAVATNGILVGTTLGPMLTIAVILPLLGQSWRLDLVLWAVPVLATALLLIWLAPPSGRSASAVAWDARRWWPDWKNPLIWLLGCTLGTNNALYFGVNAFLPDYLLSIGHADLTGAALGYMGGGQLVMSTLLVAIAQHLQRRAWPYLVFGLAALAGALGIAIGGGVWIVIAAVLVGVGLAATFVATLALPAILSPPGDVHRMAAAMFTISYSIALTVPVVSGALWDLTGRPWTAFIPTIICAVAHTVLGLALSLRAGFRW
jgi:CP family cyanate transporter-like MFS transporter